METHEVKQLKRNTVISTLSLFFKSGYSAVLGLVANLILTILLTPKIFGIYFTMLSLISLLNYFSDIGLAASLIQRKDIEENDIVTTFTVQQILIISLIILGFFATSFIMKFYKLPIEGTYLYWALLFSFFVSSLKTIPTIFLERKVQFQKIVIVQVIEDTSFYLTVSVLAILHFGLQSFTYAVIFRSIVGLIATYYFSFWIPKLGISLKHLKHLLSFGLPFQASSFLALFKDDLITLYLGKILGFEALGYIGWAKKWAEAPIRIIMDNISRVLFPVISRIQHEKERVAKLVDQIIRYQTIILAPTVLGLALVMRIMVEIIPKYSKWSPALPLFYLFCISAFFSSYSTPFINLFNAIGKVKISFMFMIIWTALTWILTTILSHYFGYYGFPITQVILSLTFIFVLWQAKKIVEFHFLSSIFHPLVSTLIMGIGVFTIIKFGPKSMIAFPLSIAIGGILYIGTMYTVFKVNFISEIKALFK